MKHIINKMSMESYMIKKTLYDNKGEKRYVLMTDGQSQVLELNDIKKTNQFISILNENTDSGCKYEIIIVKNKK
tara:strand:- start:616 stop:837 length:222 start_codon:yes stop_codon:yes gene_type:complete